MTLPAWVALLSLIALAGTITWGGRQHLKATALEDLIAHSPRVCFVYDANEEPCRMPGNHHWQDDEGYESLGHPFVPAHLVYLPDERLR